MLFHALIKREKRKAALQNKNKGFTLIELIVVIVIIGILAATATAKYIDMQRDARIASLKGVDAAIHSAMKITTAAYQISDLVIVDSQHPFIAQVRLADGSLLDVGTGVPAQQGYSVPAGIPWVWRDGMAKIIGCSDNASPPIPNHGAGGVQTFITSCLGYTVKLVAESNSQAYNLWYLNNSEHCSVLYTPSLANTVRDESGC